MVVPQQVEQAVDEQELDLARERVISFARLFFGNRNGYDDVAEELRLQVCEGSLTQGEGEHVRGPVHTAVLPVQRTHGAVSGEEDAQLCVRKPESS